MLPSLSPWGKFRAARWLKPFLGYCRKGEGALRRAGGEGVCVCVLVCVSVSVLVSVAGRARLRGGACGCDVVGAGRVLPRASATADGSEGPGWT